MSIFYEKAAIFTISSIIGLIVLLGRPWKAMLRVCLRLGRLRINVYNKHNFPPTSNFLPADADAKKNVEVLARPTAFLC